ncbi:hypothetical protein DM02DRAFT_634603 [Periconia macrospinosa]|uniref:Uncharacterized protein n=1 Tax=Periconia macrospinosa TaxID=97972 RepID=A0A2V1D896_9PLEO|nr:hypothetical protein DM02DRAFT_634603 [Periconia macrospinosa]
MKFLSVLLAVAPALATPLGSAGVSDTPAPEKRITANTCHFKSVASGAQLEYTIDMAGWGNADETPRSGCGSGLLDNLRGQCGDILNWGCDAIHENPHDTRAHFRLSGWVTTAPGWLASPLSRRATGVKCVQ